MQIFLGVAHSENDRDVAMQLYTKIYTINLN